MLAANSGNFEQHVPGGIGSRRVRYAAGRTVRRALVAATFAAYFTAPAALADALDHQHAALPVDESLTLAGAVDAAFANYPAMLELGARAEQASGRQRRLQFQVQISRDAVDLFLSDARKALDNANVNFSLLPVLATGHLSDF